LPCVSAQAGAAASASKEAAVMTEICMAGFPWTVRSIVLPSRLMLESQSYAPRPTDYITSWSC